MPQAQPLIEIIDLHHTYGGDGANVVNALRDVSLSIHSGEFVAIVGANGSGKTTLARHLNALLLPTRGRVRVAGLDTVDRSNWPAIRSQVAMVFQRPEDQIVATTVEDDVAFGPENLGVPQDEIARRVQGALATVGMWEDRHRPPHLLSVGQQQRVAIAGALAMRPRCLVLDEATAMLDPVGRREVLALLQRLHADGLTVVLITHHMAAAALADRAIALDEGGVAFDGSPRCLFADSGRTSSLGLEPPPAAQLAAELAHHWPGLPTDVLTVDELADALVPKLAGHLARSAHSSPLSSSQGALLVAAHNLHHTYLAGTPLAAKALSGVDLEVGAGEVVALVGSTGSGKSTLLQHMAGLLQLQEGEVRVAGRDVSGAHADRRFLRERVGILFQRPEEQLFERYVGDDVAFGPRQLGLDRERVRERVRWAMETVGLPFLAYKDRLTQSLSGGERRKAALAGVLALRPRLLLLDEPTAGLDPQTRREVLAALRRLGQREGTSRFAPLFHGETSRFASCGGGTLVIATHNMDDVASLAQRMVVLEDGRVVMRGSTRCVFSQPERLRSLGLDVPAGVAVSAALRSRGITMPLDTLTLEEVKAAILSRARTSR